MPRDQGYEHGGWVLMPALRMIHLQSVDALTSFLYSDQFSRQKCIIGKKQNPIHQAEVFFENEGA
jgi:hypothetical protein